MEASTCSVESFTSSSNGEVSELRNQPVGARPSVGANASLLEHLLRELRRGRALLHLDSRGLSPGLLATVLSLANNLAAHGELVGGRRVAVLGVVPDDRVAGLEHVAARTNRCGRAVDEELPVRSGLRIIAKRLARVDGRGDGIEVPAQVPMP